MRIITVSVTLCIIIALVAGCGKPASSPSSHVNANSSTEKRLTIGIIPKGTIHEFWKSIHAGAIKASKELDVDIVWKGAMKEDDRDGQIAVVEDLISKGVSGIVLAPLDDAALRAPVKNAMRAGIPVVVFDSGLKGNDYVSFVATNNLAGGRIAGEHMAKLLNGKGNVVVLRYNVGSNSSIDRENGFLEAIRKYKGIKVLSSDQYAGVTTESSYQAAENILARFRKPGGGSLIDGIFVATEPTAFGMLRALQDANLVGKVRLIGFDSSDKLEKAIRSKHLDGVVVQDPVQIGYMGVKTLVDHLHGRPVPKRVDTGARLVTLKNIDSPEIKALLHQDLNKWLKEK